MPTSNFVVKSGNASIISLMYIEIWRAVEHIYDLDDVANNKTVFQLNRICRNILYLFFVCFCFVLFCCLIVCLILTVAAALKLSWSNSINVVWTNKSHWIPSCTVWCLSYFQCQRLLQHKTFWHAGHTRTYALTLEHALKHQDMIIL